MERFSSRIGAALALMVCVAASSAYAQTWRPEKPVEIVVPTPPGGINDLNARLIQKTLQDSKAPTPVVVVNKPGGNQNVAVVYLTQHAADAHYLLYSNATIFTNQLAGVSPQRYTELTPLALLLVDYTVVTVRANSPLKSMRDVVAQLKANPEAVAFGINARGGPNHLAVAQAMRSGGIDPKKLKFALFKTTAEALKALAAGQIQAVVSSASAAQPHVETGQVRMLGIAAAHRQSGTLAKLPTMREQGIDATGISNWRGIFGAKGITPAQIAYWESALSRIVVTDEWKQQLDHNNLESRFMRSADFKAWLATEYSATRSVMADLGLVK